jgi:hypothetical protein
MKTNTLPFISLLLIAGMLLVPFISAFDGSFGGYDPGAWEGGSFGGYDSGAWTGGSFGGYDSGAFSGGSFGGFDSGDWTGGSNGGSTDTETDLPNWAKRRNPRKPTPPPHEIKGQSRPAA